MPFNIDIKTTYTILRIAFWVIPFVFTLVFNTYYRRSENFKALGVLGVATTAIMVGVTAYLAAVCFQSRMLMFENILLTVCIAAFPSLACTVFCYTESNYIAALSVSAICAYAIDFIVNREFVIPTVYFLILLSLSGAAVLISSWAFTGNVFAKKEKNHQEPKAKKNKDKSTEILENQKPKKQKKSGKK